MNRDELVKLRDDLQARVERQRQLGDYDTNAAAIRASLEASLALAQHLIDRMRRP